MVDAIQNFYSKDFDDSEWNIIDVPSMWQYRGYGECLYSNVRYPIPFNPPYVDCENPVGYYRRTFELDEVPDSLTHAGGNYHLNSNGWYSLCSVDKYSGEYAFEGLDEPSAIRYDAVERESDESDNLIENGDFERNEYYTVRTANSNGAKVLITDSNPASGNYYLKAYNIVGTNSGIRVRLPLLNKVGKYRIEFQYRKDIDFKSTRLRVVPYVYDNVIDADLTQYINVGWNWNTFTYDLDLTEELSAKADFMTSLDIYADDEGTSWPASKFYIDNIKVYEITE